MEKIIKPCGHYEVLIDDPNCKIKRLVVKPLGILSLQRHKLRSEHWFIVFGKGNATIGDNEYFVESGSSIDIPYYKTHRLENISDNDLVVIEVQRGSYFGEDDIERLEDIYGRI